MKKESLEAAVKWHRFKSICISFFLGDLRPFLRIATVSRDVFHCGTTKGLSQ